MSEIHVYVLTVGCGDDERGVRGVYATGADAHRAALEGDCWEIERFVVNGGPSSVVAWCGKDGVERWVEQRS